MRTSATIWEGKPQSKPRQIAGADPALRDGIRLLLQIGLQAGGRRKKWTARLREYSARILAVRSAAAVGGIHATNARRPVEAYGRHDKRHRCPRRDE